MCQHILLQNQNKSAIIIQSYWRMTQQKRKFQNSLAQIRQASASTVIQAYWRGYAARKQFQTVLCQRENAAVIIQKNWKFYFTRKEYTSLLLKRNMSATVIQSFWRMKSTRKWYLATLESRQKEAAAVCIQKCWRCCIAKRNYALVQIQRQIAAIVIQKNWKRFAQMKAYSSTIKKIVIVQVNCFFYWWNAFKAGKYSGDLNTGLFRYLNGKKLLGSSMVWFSNAIWKKTWPVFECFSQNGAKEKSSFQCFLNVRYFGSPL